MSSEHVLRAMRSQERMPMACHFPIECYEVYGERTDSGAKKVVFKKEHCSGPAKKFYIRCGRCRGCRIDKSREWAMRCVHESKLYEKNCFITLTINDENLEHDSKKCVGCGVFEERQQVCSKWSLCKKDFQLFMKRLREKHKGCERVETVLPNKYPIRFYHCGEYGDDFDRPHHHAALFNFCFEDLELVPSDSAEPVYRSEELASLWTKGFNTVGEVTEASAAYIARYVVKKITGEKADEHYRKLNVESGELERLLPEFQTMSRRPGLGSGFFHKYKTDMYPKDFVTLAGKKRSIPGFYDSLMEKENDEELQEVKAKRRKTAKKLEKARDRTIKRGYALNRFVDNLSKTKVRMLEHG